MAWNDQGKDDKNKDRPRDPWNNPDQGPPDLDEALNRMKDQFRDVFGRQRKGASGGGGGGSAAPEFSAGFFGVVLLALAGIWAFLGFYQVDEKERAVILRLGQYHSNVGPGLHWNPPLIDQRFVVLSTQEQDYSGRGLMLTEDENIVEVPISVQYNIPDPKAFVLNVRSPEVSLQHATDSALRHVVGSTKANDVLSEGREELADQTEIRLQEYLDAYETGIQITRVNILEAEPPPAVKAAFDDVISAKEDKERFVNEAQTYANGVVPEARGRAQRILQEAIGYRDRVIAEAEGDAARFNQLYAEYVKAPQVTRERLYLDAVEKVMANSSKVMIDVEGSGNMMVLPLDKLVSQPANIGTVSSAGVVDSAQIARDVVEQIRRENARSRRSEGR